MAQLSKVSLILLSTAPQSLSSVGTKKEKEASNVSRWTHYVSEGRNAPDDSDSTRLFNTARLRSTPPGALYGISLYSFLRILPPSSYSARTRNQNAVFSASCVAPCYHPLLEKRNKKGEEERGLISPAVIAVWPSRSLFFLMAGASERGFARMME